MTRLRSHVKLQSVVNPHVYVDGTRARDTCILESLRTPSSKPRLAASVSMTPPVSRPSSWPAFSTPSERGPSVTSTAPAPNPSSATASGPPSPSSASPSSATAPASCSTSSRRPIRPDAWPPAFGSEWLPHPQPSHILLSVARCAGPGSLLKNRRLSADEESHPRRRESCGCPSWHSSPL